MGWKDAEWAYKVDEDWTYKLPLPHKAVLAAVCMRADDKTHQTFVGQQTLVDMTGASKATVSRSLGVLSADHFIDREVRHGNRGYRTSDLITVNLRVTEPSRQKASEAESNDLHVTQKPPTTQSDVAEEITQIDHSEDHPVLLRTATFADFWLVWPRSEDKKRAEVAWGKATRRADPDLIVRMATEYANHPHRPPRQFVKHGASWLNGDCWNDPLPQAPEGDTRQQSTGDRNLAYLQSIHDRQTTQKGISA